MSVGFDLVSVALSEGFRPEKRQTVSEWADDNRTLSAVASAEPGRWRTSRVPYMREVMDMLSPDSPFERIVLMGGAQVAKTECGNNWLGHIIHRSPGPVLYVEPTLDMMKRVSRQRITPMIDASPALKGLVSIPRSRDSSNTVLSKEFRGGLLIMTGANSAASLRSMPIRYLFMDEVDEYPGDIGGQGDPMALAEARTSTFSRRKIFVTSTPTVRGVSRIEREYLASDQRRYFVHCPLCGHMDYIQWSLGGLRGDEGAHHHMVWEGRDLTSIRMCCSGCGERVEERFKTQMLNGGEWRATAVPTNIGTVGYHISTLYSPHGWKSWGKCLSEFFAAKNDPFKLKTWTNTVLGETFEEQGDSLDPDHLKARRRPHEAEVPDGVGILVAAVDVQGDRLEVAVYGFGDGEEAWLIAFSQLAGNPKSQQVWFDLDTFLSQKFRRSNGKEMVVERAVVDTGGHHTEEAYRYCASRLTRGVYPIKGGAFSGRPLVERPSDKNKYRVPLFVLCVDTGKDILLGRLQMKQRGPGFIHFPEWVDDEFIERLTAERAIRKYVKGRGFVREWTKLRERNEALDLTVYAIAALHICGQAFIKSLGARATTLAATGTSEPAAVPNEAPAKPLQPSAALKRPRKGWVGDY
mgnify:CR=1 FL=1